MKVLGKFQSSFGQQLDVMADFTETFYREYMVFDSLLETHMNKNNFEKVIDVNFLSDYQLIMDLYD